MGELVLGIDIGGTNTKFGLVDEDGAVTNAGSIKTGSFNDVASLAKAIHESLHSGGTFNPKIKSIGIGAPNANYHTGKIEFAQNLSWKGIVPIATVFGEIFNVPVKVTNDANAAALGEMLFGRVREIREFIMVTLGTGLGSGIVSNGRMIYGHTGMAGELGHINIQPNGRPCPCGRKGCLERYASATGFMLTAEELSRHGSADQSDFLSPEDITEAAKNDHPLALQIFDLTARHLARGLAIAASILSPEAIIISGGLAKAGNFLLAPTRKYFEEDVYPPFKNSVQILPTALESRNAAILGAAALGREIAD